MEHKHIIQVKDVKAVNGYSLKTVNNVDSLLKINIQSYLLNLK